MSQNRSSAAYSRFNNSKSLTISRNLDRIQRKFELAGQGLWTYPRDRKVKPEVHELNPVPFC